MNSEEIKNKLIHALTVYDKKQSSKRFYNPYALGQYFMRVDDIMADIGKGASPRKAIVAAFSRPLVNPCLKAIGESGITDQEEDNKGYIYKPASEL